MPLSMPMLWQPPAIFQYLSSTIQSRVGDWTAPMGDWAATPEVGLMLMVGAAWADG
jgi:hypothetical protein